MSANTSTDCTWIPGVVDQKQVQISALICIVKMQALKLDCWSEKILGVNSKLWDLWEIEKESKNQQTFSLNFLHL